MCHVCRYARQKHLVMYIIFDVRRVVAIKQGTAYLALDKLRPPPHKASRLQIVSGTS